MGNLRHVRRAFSKTQEQYVVARMKELHENSMDEGDVGTLRKEGDAGPQRVDKWNPKGEFPISERIPNTIKNMLDKISGQKGEQAGSQGSSGADGGGTLQRGEGEDKDQAGT